MSDKSEYEFIDHTYDVVVVGAGGAGLRATFGCADAGLDDLRADGRLLADSGSGRFGSERSP